jgi:phage gpG-like protein
MIDIKIEDDAVRGRLEAMSGSVRSSILAAVGAIAITLQGQVMDKLAGPVLKERTHHLHDSIHSEVAASDAGVMGTVGTNVVYAAYHEYGYTGTEQVREYWRTVSERQIFAERFIAVQRNMDVAWSLKKASVQHGMSILVKAHARKVDYPAHSYLRSTLAENAESIKATLSSVVEGALNA